MYVYGVDVLNSIINKVNMGLVVAVLYKRRED